MGRTKKKQSSLGRAILNARARKEQKELSEIHSTNYVPKERDLRSIIETNDLTEFLTQAELANRDFTAERDTVTIVVNDLPQTFSVNQYDDSLVEHTSGEIIESQLPIPRRPKWTRSMSKFDLYEQEKAAFLEWRRSLAAAEEQTKHVLTPFEKNIEVWRQLWRVIEKSDVIVQIVDARNPLLFRCVDLERYVREIDPHKTCILLINKSDLLTKAQRFQWARYFRAKKIKYLFWSAFLESEKQQERHRLRQKRLTDRLAKVGISDFIGQGELSAEHQRIQQEEIEHQNLEDEAIEDVELPDEDNWIHVYSREELLKYLEIAATKAREASKAAGRQRPAPPKPQPKQQQKRNKPSDENTPAADQQPSEAAPESERAVIGMVGYPNVGKSSTINVLCAEKRVAVAATPGKTKHFQTIPINEDMMLCDCPGLVFPSVTTTKAAMVCDGILPIDQLREYRAPVALACKRIPRDVFEMLYGIKLPIKMSQIDPKRPVIPVLTAEELLCAHARSRGFMSTKGIPDESRSARAILKDYVEGKLLYCHPPPPLTAEELASVPLPTTHATTSASEPENHNAVREDNDIEAEDNKSEDEEDEEDEDEEEEEWEDVEDEDDITDAEISRIIAATARSTASTSTSKASAAPVAISSAEFNQNNVIVSKKQKKKLRTPQYEDDQKPAASMGYNISYSVRAPSGPARRKP